MFRFPQQTTYCSSGSAGSDQFSSGTVFQLSRVQGSSLDINFQNSEEFFLDDKVARAAFERPVANFSLEYIATAGYNEQRLGLVTNGYNSAFYRLNQSRDFYIKLEDESIDANYDNTSPKTVVGIGNALLTSYNIRGQVGDLVRVNCEFEALNCVTYSGTSGQQVPSINTSIGEQYTDLFVLPEADPLVYTNDLNTANNITALSARDLLMEFPSGSVFAATISGDGCLLQSFNLSFEVPRLEVQRFGAPFPVERPVTTPIRLNLSVDAIMNSYQVKKLTDMACTTGHDINIIIKRPCSDELALEFYLRGLTLDSQSFSSSLDGYQTVSMNWNGIVGDLRDSGNNLFMKSYFGTITYIYSSGVLISGIDIYGDLGLMEQLYFTKSNLNILFNTGMV